MKAHRMSFVSVSLELVEIGGQLFPRHILDASINGDLMEIIQLPDGREEIALTDQGLEFLERVRDAGR